MSVRSSAEIEQISAVTILNISSYLRGLGWQSEDVPGGSLWVLEQEAGGAQLFVPQSERMRGYVGVLSDAVDVLCDVEGRGRDLILQSLAFASSDVQFISSRSSTESGTTPINDGADLYSNLRAWVLSSAVSVAGSKPYAIQPARKPQRALDFLRHVKLGPSRSGSYIASVIVPVPPSIPSETLDLEHPALIRRDEPFARRVSLSLQSATETAFGVSNRVIRGQGDFDDFRGAVEIGLSSNFCAALAGLAGEDEFDFSIDFTWSSARPAEKRPPVEFTRDHVTVLHEAAEMLRETEPQEDVQLVGNVVRLHREGNFGAGEVSILGAVEGDATERACRAWLSLADEDYTKATSAHREGNLVTVRGNLQRRGNRTDLTEVRDFEVLPDRG